MAQATILIVDDEPDLVNVLRIKLGRAGYRVLAAPSGSEALSVLAHNDTDLILLDVMIPPPDGYKVCHILKSDPRYRHIPVIMLSAKGLEADVTRGYEAGADDYITKPIKPTALVARIREMLSR